MNEQYNPSSIENTENNDNKWAENLENNASSLIKAVEEDNVEQDKLEADKDLTKDFFDGLPESTKNKIDDAKKSEKESGNDSKNEINTEEKERTANNIEGLLKFNLLSTLSSEEWGNISYHDGKLFVNQNNEMVELTTSNMISLLGLEGKGRKQLESDQGPTNFKDFDELMNLVNGNEEIKKAWLEQIKNGKENNIVINNDIGNYDVVGNGNFDRNKGSSVEMEGDFGFTKIENVKQGINVGEINIYIMDQIGPDKPILKYGNDGYECNMDNIKEFLGKIADGEIKFDKNFISLGTDSRKAWITAVQILLNEQQGSNITVDGEYKQNGEIWEAVTKFQKDYNESNKDQDDHFEPLIEDGVPGPKTLKQLLQ